MKIIPLVLLALLTITNVIHAQAPQKFSYQTVIRNAGNQLVANQSVGIKISVLQGSATGSAVYAETHSPLTNANGLASLEIGGGAVLTGNFAGINWANGLYFIKTETDLNGGSNYTISATQQLLSVPFALYSNNVNSSVSETGDTLFIGNAAYVIPGISAANLGGGGETGITAHSCGAANVHNSEISYGTMTDQEGNVYRTVVIGSQEWMAENLKTSIYRNGDAIPNVTNSQWFGLSNGALCSYSNEIANDCPLGKLYNWFAVADTRNLCPNGWHVPTNSEWNNLVEQLDPNANTLVYGVQSTIAGGKLKSTETISWLAPNVSASNESGFSALGAGGRYFNGFFDIGNYGIFWSSTPVDSGSAWSRFIYSNNGDIAKSSNLKQDGFSVRCLKD
jgi:uncharacterized protein (TIGR02145 family)